MGQKLYLECYSGISGDMTVAALSGLMEDKTPLFQVLDHMPVTGFSYELKQVKKSGIDAWDFLVKLDKEHENHDHDMEYLHGHEHSHTYENDEHGHEHSHTYENDEHSHEHGHAHENDEHSHEHSHTHENDEHSREYSHVHENYNCACEDTGSVQEEHRHIQENVAHTHTHSHIHETGDLHEHSHAKENHGHHHEHRGLHDIFPIIDQCQMTDSAKTLAKRIFQILARAEAKAHNVPVDQVHFHEVGAVDSIVDIVAAAVCMDSLQVDDVIVPFLCEGRGTVRCQHGILPVPVPAVTNVVEENELTLRMTEVEGELVTPTGAAFAAAVRTQDRLPETFRISRVGIGAGKRKYECPGILRAMLIETEEKKEEKICKLEANIDDSTGEQLGYVLGQLLEAGARDVHYTPVFMKKNRPGWQLNVICMEENREQLEDIIFRETTTIGIRRQKMDRTVLQRTKKTVQTPYGEAEVKICEKDGIRKVYPEYETVVKLCKEKGVAFQEVFEAVKNAPDGK